MLSISEINTIIINSKNYISSLGLTVIKEKRKLGYSNYNSVWLEYNLFLTSIIRDLEFNWEDSIFQKLILKLEEINNSLDCGDCSINSLYSKVESEFINEEGELELTFISLPDTPSSYAGMKGKIVTVREDEKGLEFSDSINIYSIDGGDSFGNFHPTAL